VSPARPASAFTGEAKGVRHEYFELKAEEFIVNVIAFDKDDRIAALKFKLSSGTLDFAR
jgi:hypothetical protein